MASKSIQSKLKKKFIEAMTKNLGNISRSAESVGINRSLYYDWIKDDPDFKNACNEILELEIDWVEDQLKKQIEEGNSTATIFYLKCKAKRRGYIDRPEIEINNNTQSLTINVLDDETKKLLDQIDISKKELK